MGWRIASAGTVRNQHLSRKCTGWHYEEVSCFTFQVLQIQCGHPLKAEKLLSFYPTPGSHGDGRCSALVATQPQGDAMRPLSWLTPVSASPAPQPALAQVTEIAQRWCNLFQTVWTIQLLCLPFFYSYTVVGVIWMPKTISAYTIIPLMKTRNKYHTISAHLS